MHSDGASQLCHHNVCKQSECFYHVPCTIACLLLQELRVLSLALNVFGLGCACSICHSESAFEFAHCSSCIIQKIRGSRLIYAQWQMLICSKDATMQNRINLVKQPCHIWLVCACKVTVRDSACISKRTLVLASEADVKCCPVL